MPDIELVIFESDGVLIDSAIIAAEVEAELLASAGYSIEPEELAETYAGLTFRQILLRIEEETSQVFQATLIDDVEAMVDKRLSEEVEAVEGAARAVEAIAVKRCICSNSAMSRLEGTLAGTGLLPLFKDRIFSATDLPGLKPKPAPDIFLHAARAMKADPRRTFVIDGSVPGITGARTAGMRAIGFTGASHSHHGQADLLTEAGAETVISQLRDLAPVLDALAVWSDET